MIVFKFCAVNIILSCSLGQPKKLILVVRPSPSSLVVILSFEPQKSFFFLVIRTIIRRTFFCSFPYPKWGANSPESWLGSVALSCYGTTYRKSRRENILTTSNSDPFHFDSAPDPALDTAPDPVLDPTKNIKNNYLFCHFIFSDYSKNDRYVIL